MKDIYSKGIADKMKSAGLVQIFCSVKKTNRTHSKGYVEDLSTQTGRKRCAKMVVLNLSVLPKLCILPISRIFSTDISDTRAIMSSGSFSFNILRTAEIRPCSSPCSRPCSSPCSRPSSNTASRNSFSFHSSPTIFITSRSCVIQYTTSLQTDQKKHSHKMFSTVILLLKIVSLHCLSIYGIITMYDFIDSAVHQRNTSIGFTIFLVFSHVVPKGEGVYRRGWMRRERGIEKHEG